MERHMLPLQIILKEKKKRKKETKPNPTATFKQDMEWVSIFLSVTCNLHFTSWNTVFLPSVLVLLLIYSFPKRNQLEKLYFKEVRL